MYRKHHNVKLSIEEFHVPFGGTLDPENRWLLFSSLIPWQELEAIYALQFSPTTGALAKPVRLAVGALLIRQRLGLTDEGTVEQVIPKLSIPSRHQEDVSLDLYYAFLKAVLDGRAAAVKQCGAEKVALVFGLYVISFNAIRPGNLALAQLSAKKFRQLHRHDQRVASWCCQAMTHK